MITDLGYVTFVTLWPLIALDFFHISFTEHLLLSLFQVAVLLKFLNMHFNFFWICSICSIFNLSDGGFLL